MQRLLFLCLWLAILGSPAHGQQTAGQTPPPNKAQDYGRLYAYNDSLQYETYPTGQGWGYRLYHQFRLVVNQPTIPAIAGNRPFKTEKDAKKVAQLAAQKMAKGMMPPTLSVKEITQTLKRK
jgi:hypothetical protein